MREGIGIAKIWLETTEHSYVSVQSVESRGRFIITFQNEKFETETVNICPEELISLYSKYSFITRRHTKKPQKKRGKK